MAENENDTKLISKTQTGFPPHLDFVTLRSEGIEHLGNLSGKIWTDHNVHDPGITILEVLCYALLDLGYRTQLPVRDLLTRDPDDISADDNFFTSSRLLTINPLTIADYRRLLIDIEGVKNAWLHIARDQHPYVFCNRRDFNRGRRNDCTEYLNGLYRVYIDLEKNTEKEFGPGQDQEKKEYEKEITDRVKRALLSHRNICEDFIDVKILCKWEIGVCAEIELENEADPEQVYMEMVSALRQFFSPSPTYYTLQQMLEAGKSIEEIFAGRAFDIGNSHGFVDNEEFEKLELRKSIHVSDVYNVLFGVNGINKVQRLSLRRCTEGNSYPADKWSITVPDDHVPDFSVTCSGFEFTRNGIPISFDFRKYDALLEINFEHNGKILYQAGADALDLSVPKGVYHREIGQYQSLQQEFPKVYGIAPDGLPSDVTPLRQSQALQLKGYLLFFDQLLADYLAQLKNIRSLFSMKSGEGRAHTYFTNVPLQVSDFDKLVSYQVSETGKLSETTSGILAIPVDKKAIVQLSEQDKLKNLDIEQIPWYAFATQTEKSMAVGLVQEDMLNDTVTIQTIVKNNDCVFYIVYTSSEDFVLIAKKYYSNEKMAMLDAASLKYTASAPAGFRSRILNNAYSFYVESKSADYSTFIQELTEDNILYNRRRQLFLDHLLARFAEKFTDYALLSYGMYNEADLQGKNNLAKERFLKHYPLLSATRGKAYNYAENGWFTENNSGFEKRFSALLGHQQLNRRSLCNFAVYEYAERYIFRLALADETSFAATPKYETKALAREDAGKMAAALKERSNYNVEKISFQERYQIRVNYDKDRSAVFSKTYDTFALAQEVAARFHRMVRDPGSLGKVETATWKYAATLKNMTGEAVSTFHETFNGEEQARKAALKAITRINDEGIWISATDYSVRPGKLIRPHKDASSVMFIEQDAFKTDIDNTLVGKPDKYSFEFLDKENRFKFISTEEFASEKSAKETCLHVISLLTGKENLQLDQDEVSQQWKVVIREKENIRAVLIADVTDYDEATRWRELVWQIVEPHIFRVDIEATPDTWRFSYEPGYEPQLAKAINSRDTYNTREEAQNALNEFLEKMNAGASVAGMTEADDAGLEQLRIHQQLRRLTDPADINVDVHEDSKCRFVYHLVDKDGVYAVLNTKGTTKAAVEAERQQAIADSAKDYNYLELLLKGDHIVTEDGSYFYQLRSSNKLTSPLGNEPKQLVLFQSIRAYNSMEEAETAFLKNYLYILRLALDEDNYGEGKAISEKKVVVVDGCPSDNAIVFIPQETLDFLGSYPQQSVAALIAIAHSYPVRQNPAEKNTVADYDFVLFDKYANKEIWKSKNSYDSAEAAMKAFRFFLLLLKYEGNYFIDCDHNGNYKVHLREVLAESTDRFMTEQLAWGKNGVQKFILASQTDGAFHAFTDELCCNRFFVGCKNVHVVHPCTYDTAEQRDQAMILLQKLLPSIFQWKFDSFCDDWNDLLRDFYGEQVAKVRIERKDAVAVYDDYLSGYSEIMGYILRYELCINEEKNEVYLIIDDEHSVHFTPVPSPEIQNLEDLKKKLLWLAEFLPFVIKEKSGNDYKYGIEIRLPGYDKCYAAWISECMYETCSELLAAYRLILSWLFNVNLYRRVFDCPCGPYGISLYDTVSRCVDEQESRPVRGKKIALNSVIAVNPQCYPSAEMVCNAIERAKALINSEGLHLVEHILLRPHCEEDCACVLEPCPNTFETCEFPSWEEESEDPCNNILPACFTPGRDPYSFLATVALPAWPERFNKEENRKIVEHMLHREAPAHVALRILWLTPHDLCCFESHYKRWLRWTAYKTACNTDYRTCEFVNFLFRREFECWINRPVCDTCTLPEDAISCVDELKNAENDPDRGGCQPQSWFEQITELYCWKEYNCSERFYLDCGETSAENRREPNKNRFINSRYALYRRNIEAVDVGEGREAVMRARRFVDAPAPAFAEFNKVIVELLSTYKSAVETGREMDSRNIYQAIAGVTHYYLDKLVFDKRTEDIDQLRKTLDVMKRNSVNVQQLYTQWSREGLKEMEPEAPLEHIKKVFTA